MSSRILLKPEVFEWAVRYSDLSLDEINKKFEWTNKTPLNPTFTQLQNFAVSARVPFMPLFTGTIPEDEEKVPIADFRTMKSREISRPSLNLLEILRMMELRQEWMRDYLLSEGADPLPFVGSVEADADVKEAARKIRQDLELSENWQICSRSWENAYELLREAVEKVGVLFFQESGLDTSSRKRFDPQEFRGFILNDEYAPLIFINSADAANARMFTLAHEIAHLWRGNTGLFSFESEDIANRIAAELLVPETAFRKEWKINSDLGHLSRTFKVSTIVIARRALDCGFWKKGQFWEFFSVQQRKFEEGRKQSSGGGDYYRTRMKNLSMNFVMAVIGSTSSGRTLYRDAYRLLGMRGDTFDRFADKCRNGGWK